MAIGVNSDKNYMFTLEERLDMAERSLKAFYNVKVVSFRGLLVDFAYENNIDVIIRGIRNVEDFEFEKVIYLAGESQKLNIETCPFFARQDLVHISSSTVKTIQKEQGIINEYVPIYVKKCLEEKISGQYIIGITGEIGVGKSYISNMMEEIAKECRIEFHNIELDYIGHKILGELREEKYRKIQEEIIHYFGDEVKNSDGTINRKVLGKIVFSDIEKLNKLNDIMYTPVIVRLRRELYNKKGIILINSALIAETDMTYLCNNNIIYVSVDKETQRKRLEEREYTEEQINNRLKSQYDSNEKLKKIEVTIQKESYGKVWHIDSSYNQSIDDIKKLLFEINKYLGEYKRSLSNLNNKNS
ncbi:MAG: dephospho-CoA kinase [Clostridiales bacterium GWE2_32_10]|nr:MAG: dephospho-CoA kinase [Clostridiales bacterium GWE2_32_10]HBY20117.1 dephospho-CoA kinase [Clostridiales bacterium]